MVFGNGDGTFQPEQRFVTGLFPSSVVVSDINLDGFPDIITSNSTGGNGDLSVILGTGVGTFFVEPRFAVGDEPSSVVAEDLDGDGFPDLVVANTGDADISVLFNDGSGDLLPQQRFPAGTGPRALALADLNGDSGP